MSESAERKEKFTPGPWVVDPTNYKEGKSVEASDGSVIATIVENTDFGCLPAMLPNSALIAAAPDMYAALEGLVDMIETELSVGSGTTCDFKYRVLPNARAALSKARGES